MLPLAVKKDVRKTKKSFRPRPDEYDAETHTGRWLYQRCLGAGSYGCVWKVMDMLHPLKPIRALKVCRFRRGTPMVFQLHREAQYSMRYIHNPACSGYDSELSALFVKYVEDCTVYQRNSVEEDERMQFGVNEQWTPICEVSPNDSVFDYVVLEYCQGTPLRSLIKNFGPNVRDARQIIIEAAMALDYLANLKPALVHRDFRSTNMMWMDPADMQDSTFRLKVLDLGLMLPHTHAMSYNTGFANSINPTQYNYWIPNEAMAIKGGGHHNFAFGRSSSFDVFSLGTLAYEIADPHRGPNFRLHIADKASPCHSKTRSFWTALGLDKEMLDRMISCRWKSRPEPRAVCSSLTENPRLLVNFTEPMQKEHIACCCYIGSLPIIANMNDFSKKSRALAIAPRWIVGNTHALELSIKQLITIAFRSGFSFLGDLPVRALDELIKAVPSPEQALSIELGNVKQKVLTLLGETTEIAGCTLTSEQEGRFQKEKMAIMDGVDKIFGNAQTSRIPKSCIEEKPELECTKIRRVEKTLAEVPLNKRASASQVPQPKRICTGSELEADKNQPNTLEPPRKLEQPHASSEGVWQRAQKRALSPGFASPSKKRLDCTHETRPPATCETSEWTTNAKSGIPSEPQTPIAVSQANPRETPAESKNAIPPSPKIQECSLQVTVKGDHCRPTVHPHRVATKLSRKKSLKKDKRHPRSVGYLTTQEVVNAVLNASRFEQEILEKRRVPSQCAKSPCGQVLKPSDTQPITLYAPSPVARICPQASLGRVTTRAVVNAMLEATSFDHHVLLERRGKAS